MSNTIDTKYKSAFMRRYFRPEGYEPYNDDWFLSRKGDMLNRLSDYNISHDTIGHGDWLIHLMEKRWFDANTFIPAWFEACRRARVKTVRMDVGWT